MALFANATTVGAPGAFLFNQIAKTESTFVWRKTSMYTFMATGKVIPGKYSDKGMPIFERTNYIGGDKIEAEYQATARLMYGVPVANQLDDDTIAEPTGWGAMKFDIAHYEDKIGIGKDKIRRYQTAKREKKINYLDEIYRLAEASRLWTIQNAAAADPGDATSAPSASVIGSYNHIISDGTEAGYVTYGEIDRSDAANANFRPARMNTNIGNLTLNEIGLGQMQVSANTGKVDVGWAGVNVLQRLRTIFEGFLEAEVNDDYVDFGAEKVRYSKICFGLEALCPAGQLFMGDSSTWQVWMNEEGNLTDQGIVYLPTKKAGYVLPYDLFFQALCMNVRMWCKWKGINA